MNTAEIHYSQSELAKLRKQAYKWLDKRRIPHVQGCEEAAVKLSARWGENPEVAAAAAILHDCTKNKTEREQMDLLLQYGITCDDALLAVPQLYHALTGAAVARDVFSMPEAICSAIRWHTTGKPDMTLLEKIIYLADYIEPTRNFPGLGPLRQCAFEDLDTAVALGLSMTMDEVRSKGREPYYLTKQAYEFYKERNRTNAFS